ncbi:copper-translocating P-t [Trichocladium antarcticum]|uniref:Copper-translocating P-t n=1 Tax=Trichocladium antarcticum TaxID=1450529 RepID=A0AAN6URB8_9PEZI|nr:copper-translocating P-t [Trichocladium antarcticum]
MACGSGCCGPPAAASSEQTPPTPAPVQEDEAGCCDEGGSMADKDPRQSELAGAARDELAVSTPRQDACCGGPNKEPQDGAGCEVKDAICDDDDDGTEPGCNSKGCPAPEPARPDDTRAPSCCEGKTAPCCDQSCLDRLALRGCDTSHSPTGSRATSRCGRGSDAKPCDPVRKMRKMYAEKLEALGCICRALIALGEESCCKPQRRSSAGSARRKPRPTSMAGPADSCCTGKRRRAGSVRKSVAVVAEVAHVADVAHVTPDLEKGSSGNETEHVVLSISGMTCSGCETKLVRTLAAYPPVRNLKTSLVLSRAEFDLVGAASAAEVIKHLERTTEFKCERVTNRGARLDLLAPSGDAAAFASQPWPDGVTDMRVVDKKTVSVSFDAKIIGARDLVEHGWGDGPICLAPLRPDPTLEAGSKHVRHVGYMTLLSACLTIPVLVMAWAPLPERPVEYGSASLALATLVQFAVAGPFYTNALKAIIFSRVIEMDLLVVLSTSAAYIFSLVSFGYMVAGQPLSTGEFFETSTLLVTLIMVGRWVGALARQKAIESISIRSLQTPVACLVTDDGETEIDARLLQYGDVFKVVPDSQIPTDGTVLSGSSEVDESMITGESRPVEKHTKSRVIAGSVNGLGILLVRLTRLPGDNTINTIASMVDEAKLSKPKIQDIADRVASYFVPVVLAITIVTFCIWVAIGVKVRRQPGSEATIQAITYAITVLIVSCPCAIGLAVPMVIVVASGVAAERGVIFKSAAAIEVAYKTSHVVLDKTGTITEGKLTVAREWYSGSDQNATQSLLLGLVGDIKHPVSTAVVRHLRAQGVTPSPVSDPKSLTGKGVEGTAKGSGLALRAGNSRWLDLTSDAVAQAVLSQGYTAFCFTVGGSVAAIFGLEDSLRPDAASTVKTLLDRGISVHILSGDDDGAVRSVAAQLNIAETNVRSRCTPADKQAYITDLLEGPAPPNHTTTGKKAATPVVIFCGDGTNDAVALAQATIGVHMNEGGTDVAQSAADIVLMRPDLGGIITAIAVSRKSMRRVAFNFGWSFVYNLFAVLLAAGAFVNARIPPEFAGLGELVSVLPVIAAAMLLRWSRI